VSYNLLRQLSLASHVSTLQKFRSFTHTYHGLVFSVIAGKAEKHANPRRGLGGSNVRAGRRGGKECWSADPALSSQG